LTMGGLSYARANGAAMRRAHRHDPLKSTAKNFISS
jgi:hypothetical protein